MRDCIVLKSTSSSTTPPFVIIALSVPRSVSTLSFRPYKSFIRRILSSLVMLLHCMSGSMPEKSTITEAMADGSNLFKEFLNFLFEFSLKIS